jgi:prepilin-type N-terminal cleavage/methylation domain-containing protein
MRMLTESISHKYARHGFTVLELIAVVVILGIMASVAGPAMSRVVRHNRVNRATTIVVADLQNAFATAGRQRMPVLIQADSTTRSYQFVDRKTGTVLRIRTFYGDTSDFRLSTLQFIPQTVSVFPSGNSSAPVTINLASGDYSKQITASSAGFIRVSR